MNRTENDSMGSVTVPEHALYGASTQRAIKNFLISGITMPSSFIASLGILKRSCAQVNMELGLLEESVGKLIIQAANQVAAGLVDDHFPVDIFQTGSGTSTNMNANEVIANLANMSVGHNAGSKFPVHPNDHVNLGQSSNDLIPSALNVSLCLSINQKLINSLKVLDKVLNEKAGENRDIIKLGRTHLMDAVPMTFGQQFSGYSGQIKNSISKLQYAVSCLSKLPVGGTAVGTGLNSHPLFGEKVCKILAADTGIDFKVTDNHFSSQSNLDEAVFIAGILINVSTAVKKIANDIRLMASGPRAGLNEINVPPLQPGSSIMPGKVNPVICESVIQVCHYIYGMCQGVIISGNDGYLQLNTNLPIAAHNLLSSIEILNNATLNFAEKCLAGVTVNKEKCRQDVEGSLMMSTLLVPEIGYDKAAQISQTAYEQNKTVKEAALELTDLSEEMLDEILSVEKFLD